jgi:hypothetical protein
MGRFKQAKAWNNKLEAIMTKGTILYSNANSEKATTLFIHTYIPGIARLLHIVCIQHLSFEKIYQHT